MADPFLCAVTGGGELTLLSSVLRRGVQRGNSSVDITLTIAREEVAETGCW
jgi:hypothetical protein